MTNVTNMTNVIKVVWLWKQLEFDDRGDKCSSTVENPTITKRLFISRVGLNPCLTNRIHICRNLPPHNSYTKHESGWPWEARPNTTRMHASDGVSIWWSCPPKIYCGGPANHLVVNCDRRCDLPPKSNFELNHLELDHAISWIKDLLVLWGPFKYYVIKEVGGWA